MTRVLETGGWGWVVGLGEAMPVSRHEGWG
jgi:hypothetical protein